MRKDKECFKSLSIVNKDKSFHRLTKIWLKKTIRNYKVKSSKLNYKWVNIYKRCKKTVRKEISLLRR